MAVEVTDANYDEIVGSASLPVVLDFWAAWCGPCKMVGPLIEEMHSEYEGKAIIGKVDVDNNREIAQKFGIRNIPTIAFIKNGEIVDKSVGAVPKAQLTSKLDAIL